MLSFSSLPLVKAGARQECPRCRVLFEPAAGACPNCGRGERNELRLAEARWPRPRQAEWRERPPA